MKMGGWIISSLIPTLSLWIGENWILGDRVFFVINGRLFLYLNRDWENDSLVEVLDDSKNPSVIANDEEIPDVIVIESDSKVEDNGEEIIGSDSEESNTIVTSLDDEVSRMETALLTKKKFYRI